MTSHYEENIYGPLSLENNGGAQLGGSDFGESGDYEICSERKDPWQHEW